MPPYQTPFHARGGLFNARGRIFHETMPFPVFFMSHIDLLQSLIPPLLDSNNTKMEGRADVRTGPGLENQLEDNFEDRLVADIKHLVLGHFSTALAHQPESLELIPSHIERLKAAIRKPGRTRGAHEYCSSEGNESL